MWPVSASPLSDGGHLWSSVGQASLTLGSCSRVGAPKREDRRGPCRVGAQAWRQGKTFSLECLWDFLQKGFHESYGRASIGFFVSLCVTAPSAALTDCFQERRVVDFPTSWAPGLCQAPCLLGLAPGEAQASSLGLWLVAGEGLS